MEQGARWYPNEIIWRDGDGNLVDITSYAAKLQIRANRDDTTIIEVMSSAFGDLTLGGAAGTVQIDMSAERTIDLTFTRAVYDLLLFPYVGAAIVVAAPPPPWTIDLDVDNGVNDRAVITADGGTPFSGLSADDYIAITESENGNDGVFKIYSVTNTIITLTTILPGTDNASDTAISIQELNNDQIVRLSEGYIILIKGVTV